MSTIPHTLKFNRIGEWASQQSLFKLRDTYVAYGVQGLIAWHPGSLPKKKNRMNEADWNASKEVTTAELVDLKKT